MLREKGLPKREVLARLERKLRADYTYDSGKIVGSMCTLPHDFAKQVYRRCLEKNLGDPGLFPGTAGLECEIIEMLGQLVSNENAAGHIVSGGTESNIIGLWAARNLAKDGRDEVVVPSSVHCSFEKAADLLNLRLVKVGLTDRFQMDVEAAEEAVNSKTLAVVGVAGTTDLGIVDPIGRLSEIASEADVYLHVDAAFGGFVLPFMNKLGFNVPVFDFKAPGVCSITMDPHKMGLAPIPSGGILFRNAEMMRSISTKVPYLAGGETTHSTVLGTRSGASVVAFWALLKHLGKEGYRAVVKSCLNQTAKLFEGVEKIGGVQAVTKPTINIVGIKSDSIDIRMLASELRREGWAVSLFPKHIRVVAMPHVNASHVEKFLLCLEEKTRNLGG